MSEPAPSTDTAAAAHEQTSYVVMARDDTEAGIEAWTLQAIRPARTAEAAIRSWIGDSPHNGTYVAIPQRSWKPVTVKAETKTVLTLETT